MRSKYIRKHLMPSLMAGLFLFLSACQGTSQDVNGRTAKPKGTADTKGKLARVEEDAALKSIKFDANVILPYLQRAAPEAMGKLGSETGTSWDKFIKIKNWYIGKKEHAKALENFISLTPDDDPAQYIAYQSQFEVFVDKDLLGKMSSDRQDSLILEEFLTALFTIKHLEDAQLCKLLQEGYPEKVKTCAKHNEGARSTLEEVPLTDDKEQESLDLAGTESNVRASSDREQKIKEQEEKNKNRTPKEKILQAKNLRADELAKIKKAAEYLKSFKSSDEVSTEKAIEKLKSLDFDTRIFDYQLGSSIEEKKAQQPKISKEKYQKLIADFEKATQKDLICSGTAAVAAKCQVSFKTIAEKDEFKMVSLTTKLSENESYVSDVVLGHKAEEFAIGNITDPSSKVKYVYVQLGLAALPKEKQVAGSTYRGVFVLATQEEGGLKFAGFLSLPGIVKSVGTKDGKIECVSASNAGAKKDANGDFKMTAENVAFYASVSDLPLHHVFLSMAPTAPCY